MKESKTTKSNKGIQADALRTRLMPTLAVGAYMTTCLLHNNRTCSKKKTIERAWEDDRIRIVHAYDWNSQSDNMALINHEVTNIINKLKEEFPLKFSFNTLGGKDGSIYCDICRQIKSADIALFDVSTNNLNVILELGIAIGVGAYVFILRSTHNRHGVRSLSDLNGILEYRFSRRSGRLNFKADFQRSLRAKLRQAAKNTMKIIAAGNGQQRIQADATEPRR